MTPKLVLLGQDVVSPEPAFAVALGLVLLRHGDAPEAVRVHVPAPTAAFSRRDRLRQGFTAAAAAVREHGFTPVIRPQGGLLAAYHEGSVVIDHVVRTANPHAGLVDRFRHYAEEHAAVLARWGADVRIGEVPGEYCPGEFSLNIAGTSKVAGSAQRVTKDGWLFSTIVAVTGSARTRAALTDAYAALGYELEPSTVGALEDFGEGFTASGVADALIASYDVESAGRLDELPQTLVDELEREAAQLRV